MSTLIQQRPNRIVVRGTNWVGDGVMGVPALHALRRSFPEARITLVLRPGMEGLFVDADFIDDVMIYRRTGIGSIWTAVKQWRARRFDLAILFQNAFEAALISFLARVPVRIGYPTDGRRMLLSHSLPLPVWRDQRHESFYYLNIVHETARLFGRELSQDDSKRAALLTVAFERQAKARDSLQQFGIAASAITIALCPGSINSRAKRWAAERWARLADRLIRDLGAQVILVGSRAEVKVSDDVVRQMQERPVVLTGKTTLDEAVATLSVSDLLITNDTGPAHIAAALDRPTLVIFGPTNPLTTRPASEKAQIIRRPPDCAPCMLRDCPIDHRCMTAISVEEVFDHAVAMVNKERGHLNLQPANSGNAANPVEVNH